MNSLNSAQMNSFDSRLSECTYAILGLTKVLQNMSKQQQTFFRATQNYINHMINHELKPTSNAPYQDTPHDKLVIGRTDNLSFKKQPQLRDHTINSNKSQAQIKLQQFLSANKKKRDLDQGMDLKYSKTMPLKSYQQQQKQIKSQKRQQKSIAQQKNYQQNSKNQRTHQPKNILAFSEKQLQKISQQIQISKAKSLNQIDYKDNLIDVQISQLSFNIESVERECQDNLKLTPQKNAQNSEWVKVQSVFVDQISKWIGCLLSEISKGSYYGFVNKLMNKKQTKIYFSRNVLHNFLRLRKYLSSRTTFGKQYLKNLTQIFDREMKKSLKFFKLKYPQQQKILLNQIMMGVLIPVVCDRTIDVNILQNFGFNRSFGWKEIKQFINALIIDTNKYFGFFQVQMKNLFKNKNVYFQDTSSGFTSQIGSKLQVNTPPFDLKQIHEIGMSIKSGEIMRIVIKWIQNLEEFLLDKNDIMWIRVQASITNKILRSVNDQKSPDQHYSLLELFKKQGFKFLKSCFDKILDNIMERYKELYPYIPAQQYDLNMFSAISTIGVQNLISQYLYELLRIYKKLGEKHNQITPKFEIYDMFRARCSGSYDEIQQILANIKHSKIFKIVRFKDRLKTQNKDFLINMTIKGIKLVCELQLIVRNSKQNQKEQSETKYSNDFNHFLYQLQRSKFGSLTQMIGIYTTNSQIPSFFSLDNLKKARQKLKSININQKIISVSDKGKIIIDGFHELQNESTIVYCNFCYQVSSSFSYPFAHMLSSSLHSHKNQYWQQYKTNQVVCQACVVKKLSIQDRKKNYLKQFHTEFVKFEDISQHNLEDFLLQIDYEGPTYENDSQQKKMNFLHILVIDSKFQQVRKNTNFVMKMYLKQQFQKIMNFKLQQDSKVLNKNDKNHYYILKTKLIPLQKLVKKNEKQFIEKISKQSLKQYLERARQSKQKITYIQKANKYLILDIRICQQTNRKSFQDEVLSRRGDESPRRSISDFPGSSQIINESNLRASKLISTINQNNKTHHNAQDIKNQQQIVRLVCNTPQDINLIQDPNIQNLEINIFSYLFYQMLSNVQCQNLKQLTLVLSGSSQQPTFFLDVNKLNFSRLQYLTIQASNFEHLEIIFNKEQVQQGNAQLNLETVKHPYLLYIIIVLFNQSNKINLQNFSSQSLRIIDLTIRNQTKIDLTNSQFPELSIMNITSEARETKLELKGFQNEKTAPSFEKLSNFIITKLSFDELNLTYLKAPKLKQFSVYNLTGQFSSNFNIKYPLFKFENLENISICNHGFPSQNITNSHCLKTVALYYLEGYDNFIEKVFRSDKNSLMDIFIQQFGQLKSEIELKQPLNNLKVLHLINLNNIKIASSLQNLKILIIQDSDITILDLTTIKPGINIISLARNKYLKQLILTQQTIQSLQYLICDSEVVESLVPPEKRLQYSQELFRNIMEQIYSVIKQEEELENHK